MSAKFFLQDQNGERISLNRDDSYGIRLVDVAGLGTQFEPQYANLENGFFIDVYDRAIPQTSITGTLLFSEDPYAKYRLLVNWVLTRKELFLVYAPENTEYFCQVELNFLTKTEMSSGDVKQAPISFLMLTPWYTATQTIIDMETQELNITRFTFAFEEDLIFAASASGRAVADIPASGHVPPAFSFAYTGTIVNPVLTLRNAATGEIYGTCDVTHEILSGETFQFSSAYRNSYVRKISNGEVIDLIDYVDLTLNPFFHGSITDDCEFVLSSDGTLDQIATITVYNYYRSV